MSVPQGDPIAELDDRFTRGVAKAARHVQRFLTFYAGGLGFAVAMLMVPIVHGGGSGTPASVAGPGGAAGAAGTANQAVAAPGGTSATPAGAAAALFTSGSTFASAGDVLTDGLVDGAAGAAGGSGSGTVGDRRGGAVPTVPEAPSAPDFGDDEPDAPDLCQVEAPSPAPPVSPEREVHGAQNTVEAAARQSLPVDLATTASPVLQQAACSAPEPPVDAPAVPLPATPVAAESSRSPLQILIDLLF